MNQENEQDAWLWWQSRRLRYNLGLIASVITAYVIHLVILDRCINHYPDAEITLVTIAAQGIGCIFVIGVANLFYYLGPLGEIILQPKQVGVYRSTAFHLGMTFSVALPFGVPVLVAIGCVLRQ